MLIYKKSPQDAVDWYNAIRAAKLERKKVAFPDREESDVSTCASVFNDAPNVIFTSWA